jgi:hypothetical protein
LEKPTFEGFTPLPDHDWVKVKQGADITKSYLIEAKVVSEMAGHLGKMVVLLPSKRMEWKSLENNFPEFIGLWLVQGQKLERVLTPKIIFKIWATIVYGQTVGLRPRTPQGKPTPQTSRNKILANCGGQIYLNCSDFWVETSGHGGVFMHGLEPKTSRETVSKVNRFRN